MKRGIKNKCYRTLEFQARRTYFHFAYTFKSSQNRIAFFLKLQLLILICFLASACELIVIGEKQGSEPVFDYSKNTPFGIALRFKMQLDSNNEQYASLLLASPYGKKYNAYERYEMQSEISRFKRQIMNKSITDFREDTLSESRYNVKLELDYIHNVFFATQKIKESWYIIDFQYQ